MGPVSRAFRTFSTRDLILIAIVAALGISIKPVVVPLAHLIAAPLFVPAGALAGGLYMMWLVVGMGLVPRRGTATLIALVQALLVMFTGVVGSHGAMSLVSYTAPGIVMDLGL
ncbi:MAG: ECF transporter S component, partial [Actinobacteria bacterium]|nr:ECF transporter S component [Actinomycetota bacterium]